MRRNTLLLAVLVSFFCISEASAVCRSDVRWGYDVSTLKVGFDAQDNVYKPNANRNLFDYGIIFEDANDPTCADTAAVALYKKVKATLELPAYLDRNVNKTVGAYNGWLEGANLGLVYAAALRLGANNKLTKPLASLINSISYQGNIDAYCGFGTNRAGETETWTKGNSCMDDWAMVAHARGWQAAWKARYVGYSSPFGSYTSTAIANALNTTESVCIHKHTVATPYAAPPTGPCTGTVADLASGNATAVALHGGDAMPYGVGLMTGVSSGMVGLASIGLNRTFSSDEITIAKGLLTNADLHTEWSANYGYSFNGTCFRFVKNANGELERYADFGCWEPLYGDGRTSGYQPEMFPVRDFYAWKIGVPMLSNFDYSYFQDSLFCDDPNDGYCGFFNPGRKAVYKTLGRDWVNARPALSVTTTDYTTTFKAYSGVHYLSARYGGGGDVNAEATAASTHETFSMVDLNGGALMSGDVVYLQVANGNYVSATDGGGSDVVAYYHTPLTWERFTLEKMNGTGQIYSGDAVALKVLNGQYVSAVNGGGSNVVAMYGAAITWEQFTINFTR